MLDGLNLKVIACRAAEANQMENQIPTNNIHDFFISEYGLIFRQRD
jgi:hypothetical protein